MNGLVVVVVVVVALMDNVVVGVVVVVAIIVAMFVVFVAATVALCKPSRAAIDIYEYNIENIFQIYECFALLLLLDKLSQHREHGSRTLVQ